MTLRQFVLSAQKIASIEKSNPQLAIRLWTAMPVKPIPLEQSSREAVHVKNMGLNSTTTTLGPLPTGSGPTVWVWRMQYQEPAR